MKKIAIVILNWNGKNLLQQFLPKVLQFSESATIYVIDNASTDDSVAFVAENFPEITLIQHPENYGFAKGYNEGLKQVKEPLWCLLNSDIEVTENWLLPVLHLFDADKTIGIIQPKILDFKDRDYFEYAGAAGGFIDKYGFAFCRGRLFDTVEKDYGQYNDVTPVFWASGACFFIRSAVFRQLNGFDADFFAHQEEIDLCWRAYNKNIKVYYTGLSAVYHVGAATLKKSSVKKTFLNYRNSLLMLYKNLPEPGKKTILFKRLCLDGLSGIKLMLTLKPLHCFAIIKSHFAFYSLLRTFKFKKGTHNKTGYYYTPAIVWAYFIKGKKYFSDLLS